MEQPVEREPSAPFDAETWRRMVELVNFLRLHQARPEVQGRVGEAIVRLRLAEGGPPSAEGPPTRLGRQPG